MKTILPDATKRCITKAEVVEILKELDPRYELYGMCKKELQAEMDTYEGSKGYTGSKGRKKNELIEDLWKLRSPDDEIIRSRPKSRNTFVFPKSARMPSRQELTAQYKKLTKLNAVPKEHRGIGTLTEETHRLSNADIIECSDKDPSCVLYKTALLEIISFADPERNITRIEMIEDAESYGIRKDINKMHLYMLKIKDRENNPEMLQVNDELLDASGFMFKEGKIIWANKFIRYYNTYYRGNPANNEEVLADLKRKKILTRTLSVSPSERERWLRILNFNKESSFTDKRDMLNKYRTNYPLEKIPNFLPNLKPPPRLSSYEYYDGNKIEVSDWHYDAMIEQKWGSYDDFGTHEEFDFMAETLKRFDSSNPNCEKLPTLDELIPIGISANEDTFKGGNYMKSLSRLASLLHLYIEPAFSKCNRPDKVYAQLTTAFWFVTNFRSMAKSYLHPQERML